MFCRNCGSKLPDGAMFCGNCGAKDEPYVSPAPTTPAAPAVNEQPTTPVAPAVNTQPTAPPIAPAVSEQPIAKAKRSNAKLAVVISVFAVIAVGAVAAALFLNNNSGGNDIPVFSFDEDEDDDEDNDKDEDEDTTEEAEVTTAPAPSNDETTAAVTTAETTSAAAATTVLTTAEPPAPATEDDLPEGKVFNIYAWNEEFMGFFQKYFTAEVPYDYYGNYFEAAPGKKYIEHGIKFNWIINPSDNGIYQDKLDMALLNNESAAADDKVDMFLAEADYILKYVDSPYTMDVSKIGVTQVDTEYQYTVSAASDINGAMKGVSFQCCPSALIYRRSIAKDVIGTDDPANVQNVLDSWEKFDAIAAAAKSKGYYMTASYAETYRVFSNNATSPWVVGGELTVPSSVEKWIAQAEKYLNNGYTLTSGVWGDEKNAQMFADGRTMCFFGPAWYFNFCMGNAQDPDRGCYGDWAICQGPQAHFWGGTWILAAEGSDNPRILADVMNAFTVNEEICSALIVNENQFTNNKNVNQKFASDPDYGNDFLGGQNDIAMFVSMSDNIRFENNTIYDQLLNEGLQSYILDAFIGVCDKDTAMDNFYDYVNEKYPAIQTP